MGNGKRKEEVILPIYYCNKCGNETTWHHDICPVCKSSKMVAKWLHTNVEELEQADRYLKTMASHFGSSY